MIVFSRGSRQTVSTEVIQGFPTLAADVWNKNSPHIIFQSYNYNQMQNKYKKKKKRIAFLCKQTISLHLERGGGPPWVLKVFLSLMRLWTSCQLRGGNIGCCIRDADKINKLHEIFTYSGECTMSRTRKKKKRCFKKLDKTPHPWAVKYLKTPGWPWPPGAPATPSVATEERISLQADSAWTAAALHFCVLMTLTDFPPFSGTVGLKTEKCCPAGHLVAFWKARTG